MLRRSTLLYLPISLPTQGNHTAYGPALEGWRKGWCYFAGRHTLYSIPADDTRRTPSSSS